MRNAHDRCIGVRYVMACITADIHVTQMRTRRQGHKQRAARAYLAGWHARVLLDVGARSNDGVGADLQKRCTENNTSPQFNASLGL